MSLKSRIKAWAKYPFLNEVSDYVRQTRFSLDDFSGPEMQHIIDKAVLRMETELGGKVYQELTDYEKEIFTFLTILMITKAIGIDSISKKISLFEAMRAERFLEKDLNHISYSDDSKRELLLIIFEELFKIRIHIDEGTNQLYKVKVTDYLLRTAYFHEQEWDLINRSVNGGYVYLDADSAVRLIRSELAALIHHKIRMMQIQTLPDIIKTKADYIKSKYAPIPIYHSQVKEYPPCIKHAMEIMKRNENLPHSARVMLATYLLAIDKSIEEIVALFRDAPDFNEKITRYQVEHLAGLKGSGTKYSVPSCEKLRNESLCFATAECEGIINPTQFGRRASFANK